MPLKMKHNPGTTPAERSLCDQAYTAGYFAGRRSIEGLEPNELREELRRVKAELREAQAAAKSLRGAAQRLWERLSTTGGSLYLGREFRADTLSNNQKVLTETKIIVFGGLEP
jgi:hypothetical protein